MSELAPNESFFAEDELGRFTPSELPRGPWSHEHQHAGPPSALLARAIERVADPLAGEAAPNPPAEFNVGRITIDVLTAVPLSPLTVSAEVVRPGKRVQLIDATASAGADIVMRARAWRVRASEVEIPVGLAGADPGGIPSLAGRPTGKTGPPPPPEKLEAESTDNFFPGAAAVGYHTGMEYRFASGGAFMTPGPATCWMRMRYPLVAGEEPTPLERVMVVADSGNGISATLDFATHTFINVDLSVHLHRLPEGEWVCMDSLTAPEPTGLGMTDTMLWDERGPLGRAVQTLLVSER